MIMIRRICALLLALLMLAPSVFAAEEPDPNARFRGVPAFEMEDGLYRLNRRLTTVLLMGVDKTTQEMANAPYRSGGQADFLALVVVDDANKRISTIQINRDTIVPLTVLNVLGEAIGTRAGQICLSHAFGNGGAQSCEMTADAVSALLCGTPVNYYIAMNMDGIATLNDAIGGVKVTLEDDFSAFDPVMTPGTTLTLQGKQAHYYVRGRTGVGDESNLSRIKRQNTYMHAALKSFRKRASGGRTFFESLQNELEPYLTSNLSRGALYNLGEKAGRYEIMPIRTLPGNACLGESGFMEFHADEAALKQLLAEVLFEKVS